MANSDKNIVITPNIGSSSADPSIVFSGASSTLGPQNVTLRVYPTNNGTLSFEGSAGQLFSITNSLSGTIYSVNDVSGIPSLEVLDSGIVKIAQYNGNVLIGTGTDAGHKLTVSGNINATGSVISGGNLGFINATYFAGARNPIWSFGNASTYGISYFQGAAGIAGNDAIGIHPNGTATATGAAFTVSTANSYVNNNVVLHAGNWSSYVTAGATLANDTSTNSDAYYPAMATSTSGSWTTAYVSSTKLYYNPSTGTLNATNFNTLSDAAAKTNVTAITDAVTTVQAINGVEFDWIDNGKKSAGVIAQQLETVLPWLVETHPDTGTKSVNYSGIIAYLIESVKDQQVQINRLSQLLAAK